MNIEKLFIHFNNCSNSSKIEIDCNDEIIIHRTFFQKLKSYFANKPEQNVQTIDKVTHIIQEWKEFKKLEAQDQEEILKDLAALKESKSKRLNLEVSKVRQIYNKVISKQLTGFEQIACTSHKWKKIIALNPQDVKIASAATKSLSNLTEKQANITSIQVYRDYLYSQYGKQRIDRMLKAHDIDFDKRIKLAQPLLVNDVKKITTSLIDVHADDVQLYYNEIKQALNEKSNEKIEALPEKIKVALNKTPGSGTTLLEKLQNKFPDVKELPDTFSKLPPKDVKYFIELLSISADDLEKHLLGNRVEGITEGQYPLSSVYNYIYSKKLEDRMKIQAHQEIFNHRGETELFYLELWTKLLIKMEASHSVDHHTNMLYPAPNGEWYRIDTKENVDGKFVLCLDPITQPNMPSMIVQRSTASALSASNTSWTLIQDANPFAPPGYWSEKVDLRSEYHQFLHGTNPLIITGHSLGGSFTQLNMIHFLRNLEKDNIKFPNREIKLVIFDSPALTKEDAAYFAEWAKNNPEDASKITIEYYFSKPDKVPGAGKYHLGYGCEDTKVKIKFTVSDVKPNSTTPELKLHPHGRFYFRSKESVANTVFDTTDAKGLKAYDDQTWRFWVEVVRIIIGAIFYLPLKLCVYLRNVFVKKPATLSKTDKKTVNIFNNNYNNNAALAAK